MKAVMVEKPFELRIVDMEMPTIQKDNEVLIKVLSGGICGSDIGIYNGSNSLATYPCVIGHEFGGEIVEVGTGVTSIAVGDKVSVNPVISCGECYACKQNRSNVCEVLEVRGVHRNGGFAEFVVVREQDVFKVNSAVVPDEHLALVEPFSIGMQANTRAHVGEGDMVLVMGSGPIGMTMMQVAKAKGATVIMTDIFDKRLDRAKKAGADYVVNVSKQNLKEFVMELTNNLGVTVAIDSVCSLDSPAEAMDLACPAGRVVVLGLLSDPSPIPQVYITKKELDVYGSRLSNHRFPAVIEGIEKGELRPIDLVSHRFHFTDIQKALDTIANEKESVCKVVLDFD